MLTHTPWRFRGHNAHRLLLITALAATPVTLTAVGMSAGLISMLISIPSVTRAAHRHDNVMPEITTLLTSRLNDLEVTVHVNSYDPKELEKIGKDFARTYALRSLTMLYKQPDKIRMDGKSAVLGDAVLIQNGPIRFYAVPKLKLHNREDLKNSPARRQSLIEYGGLITPGALTFMQAHFVQHEDLDGADTQVFDLTYKGTGPNSGTGTAPGTGPSSHFRVWIDPRTHITLKRAWFDSENKLKATFFYQEPHEVSPGIWLPTRIEVKNADGNTAAITTLEDPQINQGLSDDLFAISL